MQGATTPPRSGEPSQPDQQPVQAPPPLPPEQPNQAGQAGQPPGNSGYPGYPGYSGYQGYPGYQGGYHGMPPLPPVATVENMPPRPRRRNLAVIGAIIALLLTLAVGVGAGTAIGRLSVASTSGGNTIVLGSTSAPDVTVSSSTTTLQQDIENVAKAVSPSVVKITSTSFRGEAVGSGNILTADGYIITNDHVVQGFTKYTVQLSNGATYQAQLIGEAPQDDLAVLKIAATGLKPIAFADSSKVQVGEFSIAIGNPLNLGESVTYGVVSKLNQVASEQPNGPAGTLTGLIQTSAPINPGNSGGALVNLKGQLIGIPTLAAVNPETGNSANSLGFAIPANRVQFIARQLIAQGKVTNTGQGFLGIEAQDVTPQIAAANGLSVESGVLVKGFVNDAAGASPANQAGLRVNDVITAVNGTSVSDNNDLARVLQNQAPDKQVKLTVVRGTSTLTIAVTLGERPTSTQG
ncbi:MAG TPA: trypsin-like peptidase domain-containing protein [Ktedonobacterales bacterium]|nr:trypsin-like peptidase domain-containing protein [Ktedonobacterales bacterium]